jgi:hypothetical protein
MKKLMLWVAIFSISSLFAQTPPATATKKDSKDKTEVTKNKASENPKATPAKSKSPSPAMSTTTPVKKDGTPDKRYKQNKHVKKDGTPDKRYKEHQDVPKPAPATK